MLHTVNGLPTHVLLVHAVVVLLPVSALALLLAAWWPAAGRRLGPGLPLLAAGGLVLVPVTTKAGEWLQGQVGDAALVRRHVELGRQVLPWAAALLLLSLVVWWRGRHSGPMPGRYRDPVPTRRERTAAGSTSRPLLVSLLVTTLATAVAAGTLVQVARTGESGSRATWHGVVQPP